MARLFDEATKDPNANVPFRLAVWTKRRRYAAAYVAWLAKVQPAEYRADLEAAARDLEAEVAGGLEPLTKLFPLGTHGAGFADPGKVAEGHRRLETAARLHASAMAALARVAVRHLDLPEPLRRDLLESGAPADPAGLLAALDHEHPGVRMRAALRLGLAPRSDAAVEALTLRVDDPNLLVAEAALDSLVRLAPGDLAGRLSRLLSTCQRTRKELGDGPIRRQILFRLSAIPGDEATEAIARAVADDGEGDDRPEAISKWAVGFLLARDRARAARVFLAALDSPVAHVRANVLVPLGELGVKEALPRLRELPGPEALAARFRLGDSDALPALLEGLDGPEGMAHAWAIVALGPDAEPALLERIESGRSAVMGARILSRIGTRRSIAVLEPIARADADVAAALEALRRRLGE